MVQRLKPSAVIVDAAGNMLQPGDKIACAFRSGNTAELRTGEVIAFWERTVYGKSTTLMEVAWGLGGRYIQGPTTKIEVHHKRFVRI